MSEICPVYKNNKCVLNEIAESNVKSEAFKIPLDVLQERFKSNCEGDIKRCNFSEYTPPKKVESQQFSGTKVSLHKVENPYVIKADILFYPTNTVLTVDDPILHRYSRGIIQLECDRLPKPIKMGSVYETSNGGDGSKVQAKIIYHAVVAGESRLVNEEDIKMATRKALHMADDGEPKNIVMLPADCGTHDINDVARVQLAAIKTYLQSKKNCSIKNIFLVMEDEESLSVFSEYYKRIFK
jgi:O-acetyl-ADP-ribose deacetylase (regulator of RNase III)